MRPTEKQNQMIDLLKNLREERKKKKKKKKRKKERKKENDTCGESFRLRARTMTRANPENTTPQMIPMITPRTWIRDEEEPLFPPVTGGLGVVEFVQLFTDGAKILESVLVS